MIQKIIYNGGIDYPMDDAPTVYNTLPVVSPIRTIPTTVAPDGILRPIATASIPKPIIDLSQPSLINNMERPPNISDQAWAVMQSQGQAKITAQQVVQNNVAQQVLVDSAIAQTAAIVAAQSGTDAIASLQRATELSKVMENKSANVSSEITSQIIRANDAAQEASQLPAATDADRLAATATNIITTQAVADTLVKQTLELKDDADHAEQVAQHLRDVASAEQTSSANQAAILAEQRLKEANDKLIASAKITDEARMAADVTLAQAQSEAAALLLSVSLGADVKAPKKRLSLFNRIVEYIYNNLYNK